MRFSCLPQDVKKGMSINLLDFFRKKRSDLSNFLIHLTKNGSYEAWREMDSSNYAGRYLYGPSETIMAEDSLRKILTSPSPTLLARSPFGVFKVIGINVSKNRKLDIPPEWLMSVCFSETPLRELPSFYRATQDPKNWSLKTNRYQKFGLAFDVEHMRSSGGHPVFYYDRRQTAIQKTIESLGNPNMHSLTRHILALCEPYGPKILEPTKEVDFRWEREWRVVGNFKFSWQNVAFGICPEEKIPEFEILVKGSFPFLDPDWEIDRLKSDLEKRGWTQLAGKI
ncbi:MAG: hypothetical protein JWQ35_1306 [Bacteriovoracaceae bacterium]|nr:hypothetical protein [Bacteriovoracaceae bacterium]